MLRLSVLYGMRRFGSIFQYEDAEETEDMVRHLEELIGYILQPDKNLATWWMLKGAGNNGKSLVCDIMIALAGKAALAVSISSLDTKMNNHALDALPGMRLVIDDDLESNTTLADGMLKKISENKTLHANPKFRKSYPFKCCVTPVMATNRNPPVRDLSYGTQRRAMIIPFDRQFSKAEDDLDRKKKLRAELPGILNRALDGYKRLRDRGRFLVPKRCVAAVEDWLAVGNPVAGFLHHCVKITDNEKDVVKMSAAYKAYNEYCYVNGHTRPLSKGQFWESVISSGVKEGKPVNNSRTLRGVELIESTFDTADLEDLA